MWILDTLVRRSQVFELYEGRSEEVGTALFEDDSAHESVMRQPKQRILVTSSRVS
jgi:hypothetical protein